MEYSYFRSKLISLGYGLKCLPFLADRIASDNYRGIQISQHNRYTVEMIITLLEEMYKLVGTGKMAIRNTDLSKRPENTPEEYTYACYVNEICKKTGRGTQDSIRKNFFVDLHRMGLILRYDNHGHSVGAHEKSNIRYVSLTTAGLRLIQKKNDTFKRDLEFSTAIFILTQGFSNIILNLFLSNERIHHLSTFDFMFFCTFIGKELNGHRYSSDEIADFIFEFQGMPKSNQEAVINLVKIYCTPSNFHGDKTCKRDFGNWKNETQQIFMLLNQTAYFSKLPFKVGQTSCEKISIMVGKNGIFDTEVKLKRSILAKQEYFKKHRISKIPGFELHHIIPLSMAETREEFFSLDVWNNLIYIDGYTHSIISQTGNNHIVLSFKDFDVVLSDKSEMHEEITCYHGKNVLYLPSNSTIMLQYNQDTLNSL